MLGTILKGRYKLIDERGSGAVATVYVSRDLLTNSIYAVKVLHAPLNADADAVQRLQREAQMLKRIHDPHVVRFIDAGVEGGRHYLVMEYVDGQTLKQRIVSQGRLPLIEAIDIARQAALGLAAAASQQVVHRDIKPQNILLSSELVVKLTDFGTARDGAGRAMTQWHVLLGTPYYMAPEQVSDSHEVDIRADLYALACVLFEALSGRVPFEANTAMDVVRKHVHEPVPSIHAFCPEVPAEFDRFFQQAMAKAPAARFQTPADFIAALAQLPVVESGPSVSMAAEASSQEALAPRILGQVVHLATGRTFLITQPQTLIGRSDLQRGIFPEIDLAPLDSGRTVSRRHALILAQHGRFYIKDLNAFNRTRLNRVVLTAEELHPLHDGDVLSIGDHDLRFRMY
jgi:serine/threonine protein kinase